MAEKSNLSTIKQYLEDQEARTLSEFASLSVSALRRRPESAFGHRQAYSVDADRILHSKAYTRYIDKTQVFYMVENDHITHRVLHVQLVSKIARTVGRFLRLNEDLIEAIALGHDLGHPPFGHDGEHILSNLCQNHAIGLFLHNVQSVRFLDRLEKKGRGLNLSLQVLDGILCHDGEVHSTSLTPEPLSDFNRLQEKISQKETSDLSPLRPMTLEGCVVRMCDTIAYIGRDIEDAIQLGLINRHDIPSHVAEVLGNTNGTIVYTLVTDLIENSSERGSITLSEPIAEALLELKQFNYQKIYLNPSVKLGLPAITECYKALFDYYLDRMNAQDATSPIFQDYLEKECVDEPYTSEKQLNAVRVRDFIAGMTDDYFLEQAKMIGCTIPQKK